MRATARVAAIAGRDGRTRLAELRGEPPLLLRRTGASTSGGVEVHLVGGAAGPLGGDLLRLEIEVGAGATLCLRTVAASIALPGRDGAVSQMRVCASVAAGGRLVWLPEPLIAAAGCRHDASSTVELSTGASLVWRDELVCGRHGEATGQARLSTAVRLAGRPLYQHELAVGPTVLGWSGPAVLGGGRAAGSVLLVDPSWTVDPPASAVLGPTAALMPLSGPAMLATATGADLREVRAQLDACPAAGALPLVAPAR
jgi:urease accessory protein